MNDVEREQWVNNDEYLYSLWKDSGLSMRTFIREQRDHIDQHINSILNRKPSS
jgi:hypothetical protein